jgi:hypothetical protein
MKLSIPQATFATLLSSGTLLSPSHIFSLAKEATDPTAPDADPEDDQEIEVKEKFLHLRKLLRAKFELRKKLRTSGGHLVASEKECNTHGDVVRTKQEEHSDVGILLKCDNPYEYCVKDPFSRLGGVCARVVSNGVVADDSATKGDSKKHAQQLKPLTRNDKLKAKHLLEQSKLGRKGSAGATEDKCTPSIGVFELNERSIDVGIPTGGCKSFGHVCVKDPSSSLGGTCVDITSSSENTSANYGSNNQVRRHLTSCHYINGTAGTKCSGVNSCDGLDPSFIASDIGCGSCNGYGSCSSMTREYSPDL